MSTTLLPLFICIIIPAYWFWRTYESIRAREEVLNDVDAFLGSDRHSAQTKRLIYCAYEDSQEHFFALKLILNTLFINNTDRAKFQKFKKANKTDYEAATGIIKELFLINIKLSPITWILAIFFFLFIAVLRALRTPATDKMSSFEKQTSAGIMKAINS
jgi:hypothetical protein